jgi:hypothetical protein
VCVWTVLHPAAFLVRNDNLLKLYFVLSGTAIQFTPVLYSGTSVAMLQIGN